MHCSELEDRHRSPTWPPPYELLQPIGERVARLEEERSHQRAINGEHSGRLARLEQAQRRGEQLAKLKAARKAARRDVVKTAQWVVSIAASALYAGHLVHTGQWVDLLRFVLGFDN